MKRSVCIAITALLLSACGDDSANGNGPAQGGAPAPEVEIVTVESRPVAYVIELPGRVQALRTAEIRARVSGIIQERLFREGSDVEAGDELFLIDPREMEASLGAARASLQRAEATAANAKQDVERYKGLVAQQAISQQEYDTAVARLRTAEADVAEARSRLATAQLNLEYTRVTSPIEGRVDRAQVSEGALVSAAEGTLLTTVEQFDPVYVNFSQSSSELLSIRSQLSSGALERPDNGEVEVTLTLEDGSDFAQTGKLDFFAMTIDQATGTVALRAEFPNPERLLLPGQFVNARIQAGVRPAGMRIPQRAVQMSEQGATVMLLDAEDQVQVRPVSVGEQEAGLWVITEGLSEGDRVVVAGLQKIRPGQKVRIAGDTPQNSPPAAAPEAGAEDAAEAEAP
ncbi:MAG: efflux RND transporter periplasmic adaptor subunit [Pseudomonas sp.]